MANMVVHEFFTQVEPDGSVRWPPKVTTRDESPCSVSLNKNTLVIVVTSDADTRMTWDGEDPSGADIPILSAIPNQFAVYGTERVVKFQ